MSSEANNPWHIPTEVFDEGVDLNTILPLIELTILVVMVGIARGLLGKSRPSGTQDA